MKKFLFYGLLIALLLLVFSGCAGRKIEQQSEISTYYSMIYSIGQQAFAPIAEQFIKNRDRVLIVNTGEGFKGVGARYSVIPEKKEDTDVSIQSHDEYIEDHPFFIEYLENGFVRSILKNSGSGFERLNLANYSADYVNWLKEHEYIFNTSQLQYDWWHEIENEFSVTKMLIYSVNRVVDNKNEYVGIQLGLKLIDVANGGKILWDSIENVVSKDYPENKMNHLDHYYVEIPQDSITAFNEDLAIKMEDMEISNPIDVILVKIDDISVFGNYPITIEDFIVEQELANKITALQDISVLEKLYKRRYKEEWQLINAVHYINPFMGGEYSEFEQYYGTRYMMGYKILWSEQLGEIETAGTDIINLKEKVLGIYVKIVDMADEGRILLSHFMPVASKDLIETNFIYKSFTAVNSLEQVTAAIEEQGSMEDMEKCVIINKRMEIFKNYLISSDSEYEAGINLFNTTRNDSILTNYDKVYGIFDDEKLKKIKGDIYYILAVHLINGWFEEGLNHLLVNEGYSVIDKLESIYSRYLITEKYQRYGSENNIFLSPLLLKEWGENIKNFYDVDKIIHYIALEKSVPDSDFVTPDIITGEAQATELSQYYPILSYELEYLLFSILDVTTGDYLFDRNFNLEEGGN